MSTHSILEIFQYIHNANSEYLWLLDLPIRMVKLWPCLTYCAWSKFFLFAKLGTIWNISRNIWINASSCFGEIIQNCSCALLTVHGKFFSVCKSRDYMEYFKKIQIKAYSCLGEIVETKLYPCLTDHAWSIFFLFANLGTI